MKIDQIIKDIIYSGKIINNKIIYSGINYLKLEDFMLTLDSKLCKDADLLNKLNNLRFSKNFPKILHILYKMKKNEEYTYNNFKKYLLEELENIKSRYPIKAYELYYLINVDGLSRYKFKYKDIFIELIPKKSIDKIIKKIPNNFFSKRQIIKPTTNCSIIKIKIYARTSNFAEEMGTKIINFILGLFILIKYNNKIKRTIVGEIEPISFIKLIYIFVFNDNKFLNYFYFQNRNYIKLINKKDEFTKEHIILFRKMIKKILTKCDENTINYFISSISNYFIGVTEQDIDYSYLKLWTALELLINLNKKHIKYEIIKNRLKAIYENEFDKSYIDRLIDLRNNFVHTSGYRNISQVDRNRLKLVYESLFYFIYNSIPKYTLNDIGFILDNLDINHSKLENNKKLINSILKMKKKEQEIEKK